MSTTPTIILVHHTLGGNDGELVDAERLFELLRPHRHVKAIMFGHSHKYEVTVRDGLQLINLPAVGYNFVDTEPVGWVDSVWTDEGVDLTLRSIGGNQLPTDRRRRSTGRAKSRGTVSNRTRPCACVTPTTTNGRTGASVGTAVNGPVVHSTQQPARFRGHPGDAWRNRCVLLGPRPRAG